jgi:MATE family multidrug resistance protein
MLFIFMPALLVNLFLDKNDSYYQAISQFATSLLSIAALFQSVDALQAILNGALRGLKDTFIPMLWCITCYWLLGIGSSYYLAFHTSLGAQGIWYGLVIGIASAACVLMIRFFCKGLRTPINLESATASA